MKSDSWALEFVGGPLDGRRDIPTPVICEFWIYQTCVPEPMSISSKEISLYGPQLFFTHRYRRASWRSKQGNLSVAQDIWLYQELQPKEMK